MLLILLVVACVLLASLGLMICRAAALSDESHQLAIAEWLAAARREQADESRPAEHPGGLPLDGGRRFRATG